MRRLHIAVWVWVLWLMAGAGAQAQVQSFTSIMNGIVRGTPGVTSVVVGTGIRTVGTGLVPVATPSLTIPVSTTVAVDVGYGAVARGLGAVAMRASPWIAGAVAVGYAADALRTAAYPLMECKPPMYWCKPGKVYQDIQTKAGTIEYRQQHSDGGDSGVQTTAAATCAAFVASRTAAHGGTDGYKFTCADSQEWEPGKRDPADSYRWVDKYGNSVGAYGASPEDMGARIRCPDGKVQPYTLNGECKIVTTSGGEPVPADIEDVNKALSDKANADHNWALAVKQEMDKIAQANPDLDPPIAWKGLPITVTADPVTGPEAVQSVQTLNNPDGTTSTQTVKTATTVTPVITPGGTVDNPGVSYPSKTVTTTTTINNTTNVKNETTNITKNEAKPQTQDLPTDYAREATLRAVLQNLTTEYTGPKPTGDDELKNIDKQNKDNIGVVDGITPDTTGLKGWLPTIKTATCRNPKVPQPISGAMLEVPICDSVDVFASIISAVIAVFALYGSVREVQWAIKA